MIKLLDILLEDNKIFVPRRSEERKKKRHQMDQLVQQKVQEYIDGGSQGSLYLNHTTISSLPDNLKIVRGSLNLRNTSITSLPSGLKIKGDLNLNNTPLTSLPSGLEVSGALYLGSTPITSLPSDLKVKDELYLKNTPLAEKYTEEDIRQMCPGVKKIFLRIR